jgi:hypothetical protein
LENEVGDAEIEEKLETLRRFLELADFRKLRAGYEKRLAEGEDCPVQVYLENVCNTTFKEKIRVIEILDIKVYPSEKLNHWSNLCRESGWTGQRCEAIFVS